jgi:streptogramin lyase
MAGASLEGRIVKVPGLASPFDIIVDPQNHVWVSNSQSDTVLRFAADTPPTSKPSMSV